MSIAWRWETRSSTTAASFGIAWLVAGKDLGTAQKAKQWVWPRS